MLPEAEEGRRGRRLRRCQAVSPLASCQILSCCKVPRMMYGRRFPYLFFDKKSLLLLLKCECIQKVQFRMNVSPLINCSFPLHFCQRISACFLRAEGGKRGANLSFAKSLRSPQKRRRMAMLRKTLFYTHVCGTGGACQDAVQNKKKRGLP